MYLVQLLGVTVFLKSSVTTYLVQSLLGVCIFGFVLFTSRLNDAVFVTNRVFVKMIRLHEPAAVSR